MRELALFAGAGGGILGGILLGWRTVCAVESDPYCCDVLAQRQDDGILAPFPIWQGDIRDFDGRPWAGVTDVVSGGFPCTDISSAGKGAGIEGEQSGLWKEMARIIGEVRPRHVFVENSPVLTSRGLGVVLGDLAALGFDAEWGVLGAHHVGGDHRAPHVRDRIWIVAHSEQQRLEGLGRESGEPEVSEPRDKSASVRALESMPWMRGLLVRDAQNARTRMRLPTRRGMGEEPVLDWWKTESNVDRVAHGVAYRVDRLKAIGNGQMGSVAALAWATLIERMHDGR